ncbi:transient receptor putative cation channel subfamily M member 8 [Cichlidogyrus casuarinus]|uniref:Transient receptor putative cation channel subfamily M member 8 n=1 Tax=Cichlidogyrus casuarinus TaxID=1844966 RepID=A0ABD2PU31_9PLAT
MSTAQPLIRLKKPLTVYDELRDQYGWSGYPRLNFIIAVHHSPSVKFLYHSIFHLVFLCIFSYVLVCDLTLDIKILEKLSLLYVLGYILEEGRQFAIEYLRDGAAEYLKDMWNWIDLFAIFCTIIGGFFRIPDKSDTTFKDDNARNTIVIKQTYNERIFYICGLTFFYMRTLYFTSIWPIIGASYIFILRSLQL